MKTAFPLLSIEIQRDAVDIRTMHPAKVPDPAWRYVDFEGHGHFWQGAELPTLEWVVTGQGWAGDEIDGSEYDIGEWRCKQCEEVVEPQKKLEYGPTHIPGPTMFIVSIGDETFSLTAEEYEKSLSVWKGALQNLVGRSARR